MKNNTIYSFIIFIVILGLFVFSIIYFQPRVIEKETITKVPELHKVISVIDGDTIEAEVDGKTETIRLLGIDTPEVNSPYTEEECFGQEAKEYATQLLNNQEIYLIPDKQSSNRDKYNRLLRYVFLPDGLFVDAELIKNGYAYNYIYEPFEFMKQFDFWEKEAKKNKMGLWGECFDN